MSSAASWTPLLWLLILSRCEKWADGSQWYDPLIPKWPLTPEAPPWWPGSTKTSTPALPTAPNAPKFPSREWEPDRPPPPAVQLRAVKLLPTLWAKGVGSYHTEHTGKRWITSVSYTHLTLPTNREV